MCTVLGFLLPENTLVVDFIRREHASKTKQSLFFLTLCSVNNINKDVGHRMTLLTMPQAARKNLIHFISMDFVFSAKLVMQIRLPSVPKICAA